ncbi:hypothetical protein PQQ87_12275 [Paraburkholderia nemoris]|uniref:hypothetical protein n=1 Tax=Paraburkholderia nemoris TaxID=2793076 RepID=UPI0038BCDDFD
MDSQYLQHLRFQLQKRVKRLNSCNVHLFHSNLVQFWGYLNNQPLFAGILARMDAESPRFDDSFESTLTQQTFNISEREDEARAYYFRVIQHCALEPYDSGNRTEVQFGQALSNASKYDECLDTFREEFLEPFYELLDEALDQQTAALSLLIKYKRKIEWFERDEVAKLAETNERTLAKHLYAYLFDQGLDFHIEPQSVSGEADLVSPELVLDAKIFDGMSDSRGTRYIKHGVNQLLNYTRDFNQSVGYLVIYRTCEEDLQFGFANAGTPVPFLCIGGKTLYFLVVDICNYDKSASKRGGLKAHVLNEEDILKTIAEKASEESVVEFNDASGAIENVTSER